MMLRASIAVSIACLLSVSLLPCIQACGQTRSHNYPLRIPIYKSKNDSIRLHLVEAQLNELRQINSEPVKTDSLITLYERLLKESIVGFRRIYLPAPDHVSLDSLREMKDLLTVKKVTIRNYFLEDLPEILFQCYSLESLELINTKIRQLPDKLNVLTKLTRVSIYNHAGKRPLKLIRNDKIKELIIRGDNPNTLPRSYRSFSALNKLDVAGNFLKRFPQGARHNQNLREPESIA